MLLLDHADPPLVVGDHLPNIFDILSDLDKEIVISRHTRHTHAPPITR